MLTFDFINGEGFRRTLEADYKELEAAMKVEAWKAVHVLAGSIIEAVLADYLIASGYQKRHPKEDPLRMELKDLISTCSKEKVLTEATEQLSQVIRGYRNLIHPGRIERENEHVNEHGAVIARALVNLIVEDVSTRKSASYGYTAEQIVAKIERDTSTSAILEHLLVDTNEQERNRLLLEVIPQRYSYYIVDEPSPIIQTSLGSCFRLIYDKASEEIKKKMAKLLVKVIKEGSRDIAYIYETVFFRANDLEYFSSEDARLVKRHLFSALSLQMTGSLLDAMQGIGKYITIEEIPQFIEPFIKVLTSEFIDAPHSRIREYLQEEYFLMSDSSSVIPSDSGFAVYDVMDGVFKKWINTFEEKGNETYKNKIQSFWDSIYPF